MCNYSKTFIRSITFVLTISVFFSTLSLTGCATADLWRKQNSYDNISSFYVSSDLKKLIIVGDEYHYLFDAPESLTQSLTSPIHDLLKAEIPSVHLRDNGEVYADYKLFLDKEDGKKFIEKAKQLNYKDNNKGSLVLQGSLEGKRYTPTEQFKSANIQSLNRTYQIELIRDYNAGELAGNLALSPITIANDGVLLLFLTPVIAVLGVSVAFDSLPKQKDESHN